MESFVLPWLLKVALNEISCISQLLLKMTIQNFFFQKHCQMSIAIQDILSYFLIEFEADGICWKAKKKSILQSHTKSFFCLFLDFQVCLLCLFLLSALPDGPSLLYCQGNSDDRTNLQEGSRNNQSGEKEKSTSV